MQQTAPDFVAVIPELMTELLNAASRTALAHRNQPTETYVLGQMEATANVLYVLCAAQGFDDLEANCQRVAFEAINRLNELNLRQRHVSAWQTAQTA